VRYCLACHKKNENVMESVLVAAASRKIAKTMLLEGVFSHIVGSSWHIMYFLLNTVACLGNLNTIFC